MPTKILAVDDNPAILEVLQIMLEDLGCDVLALSDSRQAAEQVKQQEFDGILLDAQMPFMDGLELAQLIRHSAKNPAVPIVMLTGSRRGSDRGSSPQGPVTFFMEKPFDMHALERVLADIAACAATA
jgi:CheY-like chemotaxis protein